LALLGGMLAAACSPVPPKTDAPLAATVVPVPVEQDLMLKLLAANFALRNGDHATAAARFREAAQLTTDPEVAGEAARVAVAVKDWPVAQHAVERWRALAPGAVGVDQVSAWIAFGTDHPDRAFEALAAILARGIEDGWRLVGQVLVTAGEPAVAAKVLARLATPERLGAQESIWIAASQLAYKLEDAAQAERLAQSAVERFHGAEAYAWQARLAVGRGDKQAARAAYLAALGRDPGSVRLRTGYAALLADMGDNAAAAAALAHGQQDDVTYQARAAYAARARDKAVIAKLYRELEADKSPRSGTRLFLLGQVAELAGHNERALSWYRQVPDDDEHWFDAQTRQAVVLDLEGRLDEAIDFLHALQAQTGEDAEQSGNAYLLEADLLTRHERRRDALVAYTRGLDILADDERLLYARALLEVDLDDIAAAERDLRRLIELKPGNADALNALGYTLADRTPRKAEALALIEEALKLKPDEPAIIDSMGWVQYRLGNLDAAIASLRRAFARQPDAEIAAHLGEVLWVKGERDEARRVWEQGRKQDAKNKPLLDTIRRLTT
jgi:tetratricopeptide (TPR) repeat protein